MADAFDTDAFDKDFWERHWRSGSMDAAPPNPYLARELGGLVPGTVLDAGCGAGAEAVWLAARGWEVTAADISAEALARAGGRAAAAGVEARWVEADLCRWVPDRLFDVVTTHYAHPAMPQLDFYARIGQWVAPGGTLLVVGHLHGGGGPTHGQGRGHGGGHGHGHDPAHGSGHGSAHGSGHGSGHGSDHVSGHQPPPEASVTAASITARLDPDLWDVVTAEETSRTVVSPAGHEARLHDVVVRAIRRASSSVGEER